MVLNLWPRERVPRAGLAAAGLLGAFAVWTAISLAWAGDDGRGFVEVVRALGYLGLFVLTLIAARRGSAGSWLGGLALGTGIVVLIAVLSRLEPSLIDNGREEIGASLGAARGRLAYPLGYWNAFGGFAAGFIVLALAISISQARRALRCAAVAAIPVAMLGLFLSSSRGGIAAGLVGLVVLFIFARDRLALAAAAFAAGAGGGVLIALASSRDAFVDDLANSAASSQGDTILIFTLFACAAAALIWLVAEPLSRAIRVPSLPVAGAATIVAVVAVAGAIAVDLPLRLDHFNDAPSFVSVDEQGGVAHLSSGAGNGRWQFWEAADDAFGTQPVRGLGAGGYEAYWTEHGALSAPVRNAHSLLLETLAELGLVGGVLLSGFLIVVAVRGIQIAATRDPWAVGALALFGACVAQSMIDWTWELPATFGPAIVAAGLLLGPALAPARSRARSAYGWGLAALIVGFATIWGAGILLLGETKIAESQEAVADGDLAKARKAAEDASTLQPWSSEPKLQLALVNEQAGEFGLARDDVAAAIAEAPGDWRLWVVAARLDVKAGKLADARAALDRVRELNPRAGFLQPEAAPDPTATDPDLPVPTTTDPEAGLPPDGG